MISPYPTHINISHMTFVVTQLQDFLFLEGSQIIKGFAVNMFLQTMFGESRPLRWYHTLIKVHCVSSCITSQGCVHKGVFVLPAWRPDSNKKKEETEGHIVQINWIKGNKFRCEFKRRWSIVSNASLHVSCGRKFGPDFRRIFKCSAALPL